MASCWTGRIAPEQRPSSREEMSVLLPADIANISRVRHAVRDWLTSSGTRAELVQSAESIVGELLLSVAQPPESSVAVRLSALLDDRGLTVRVSSPAGLANPEIHGGIDGLELVRSFADRLEISTLDQQTTMLATLELS